MKKLICLCCVLCFVLALPGCVDDRQGVPNPANSEQSTSTEPNKSQPPGSETQSGAQAESTSADPTAPAEQSTALVLPESDSPQPGGLGVILKGKPDADAASGLAPLPTVHYDVPDPNNSRGLSEAKKEHSHGPASGGKAHHTVEAFQDLFDRFGALTLDRTSSEKVLYLTFDCGWEYDNLTSVILDTLRDKQTPAAFFCTLDHIKKQPALIARMIREGHIVGNHSDTHPSFPSISRTQMVREIENTENELRASFGYCAKFFRFPAGEYNESALDLLQSMGYRSVFWSVAYNDWNIEQVQGAETARKTVIDRLHPGAVILLHAVSKDNAAALGQIIDDAQAQGYIFRALSDYRTPEKPTHVSEFFTNSSSP